MNKIGIVGCGNLGLSILKGIQSSSFNTKLYGSKRNISDIKHLANDSTVLTEDNALLINKCDIIILALKPYTIIPFIRENKDLFSSKNHTIVSCATGITIAEIRNELDNNIGVYINQPLRKLGLS